MQTTRNAASSLVLRLSFVYCVCGCNFTTKNAGRVYEKNGYYAYKIARFVNILYLSDREQNQAYLSHGTGYPLQIFYESSTVTLAAHAPRVNERIKRCAHMQTIRVQNAARDLA